MCKYCGDNTCRGDCWSALLACLRQLCCCCFEGDHDSQNMFDTSSLQMDESGTSFDDETNSEVDEEADHDFQSEHKNFTFVKEVHAISSGSQKPNREPLTEGKLYNCWGFALQPITKKLVNKNPKCYSRNSTTVDQLAQGIVNEINELNSLYKCSASGPFSTYEDASKELMNREYLIAVRVANPEGGGGYHCIRYKDGEWKYKQNSTGALIEMPSSCNPDNDDAWNVYDCAPEATSVVWHTTGSPFMPFKSKTMYIRVKLKNEEEH